MSKCPHCGSIRYHDLYETIYDEDGSLLNVIRRYTCLDCGRKFKALAVFTFVGYEELEET